MKDEAKQPEREKNKRKLCVIRYGGQKKWARKTAAEGKWDGRWEDWRSKAVNFGMWLLSPLPAVGTEEVSEIKNERQRSAGCTQTHRGKIMCQEKGTAKRWNTWTSARQRESGCDGQHVVKHDQLHGVEKEKIRFCVQWKPFATHTDLYHEHTLHSHMVHESFFHRSPSVRSRPSPSVQSVLLRRASSFLIYRETRTHAFSQRRRWHKSLSKQMILKREPDKYDNVHTILYTVRTIKWIKRHIVYTHSSALKCVQLTRGSWAPSWGINGTADMLMENTFVYTSFYCVTVLLYSIDSLNRHSQAQLFDRIWLCDGCWVSTKIKLDISCLSSMTLEVISLAVVICRVLHTQRHNVCQQLNVLCR